VLGGLPPGDPGGVHQPGPGGPLPVGHGAVPGVEGRQQAAADRGLDRVDTLQYPQSPRLFLVGQVRRVRAGQGGHCEFQDVQRVRGAGWGGHRVHVVCVTSRGR